MNTLRDLRKAKGWSQERLAQAAGVSTSTVYVHEAGKRTAEDSTILAYAGALKVDWSVLSYLRDEPGTDVAGQP